MVKSRFLVAVLRLLECRNTKELEAATAGRTGRTFKLKALNLVNFLPKIVILSITIVSFITEKRAKG
jgi:hypothetical protein